MHQQFIVRSMQPGIEATAFVIESTKSFSGLQLESGELIYVSKDPPSDYNKDEDPYIGMPLTCSQCPVDENECGGGRGYDRCYASLWRKHIMNL
jgi:hypothetical protein